MFAKKDFQKKAILMGKSRQSALDPHKCDVCQKIFSKKAILLGTSRQSTLKRFLTSVMFAKKDFQKKGNLDGHIKAVHLKETPHKCDVCQKGFSKKRQS